VLYKVMKERGLHESCLQQELRLFGDFLYDGRSLALDEQGRIRLDDREMRAEVQAEVSRLLAEASSENIEQVSDIAGFREEFLRHHGFGRPDVDYAAHVQP
jgi:enoyl-[acyl-carrier protein] reductase/trans-2-enoyl-CoA reductase (NAD+)